MNGKWYYKYTDGMYRLYSPHGVWIDLYKTERQAIVMVNRCNTPKVI